MTGDRGVTIRGELKVSSSLTHKELQSLPFKGSKVKRGCTFGKTACVSRLSAGIPTAVTLLARALCYTRVPTLLPGVPQNVRTPISYKNERQRFLLALKFQGLNGILTFTQPKTRFHAGLQNTTTSSKKQTMQICLKVLSFLKSADTWKIPNHTNI